MIHPKLDKLHMGLINRPLNIHIGDYVKVHYKIKEGNKERIQIYDGTVIAVQNKGVGKSITVRKISFDVGVERIFPLYSPSVDRIEKVRSNRVRRAKLYYLRQLLGKKARLQELKKAEKRDNVFTKADEHNKANAKPVENVAAEPEAAPAE